LRWQGEPGLQALRLDLQAPGIRLALSALDEAGLPIDARPAALSALAAVNASFFDRQFRVRGLTVSEGQHWPSPLSPQDSPLLACTQDQRCELLLTPPYQLPSGTHTAVAGTPWLLRQGQARTTEDDGNCAAFCANPHPRTALGISANRRHLFILVAEGRRPGTPGISLAETAAWMQRLGAHDAFNLDGGGSSALMVQGKSAMQRPANEPSQRRVANVLMILSHP
jgi:exopolysaccharide biosynthesis protein